MLIINHVYVYSVLESHRLASAETLLDHAKHRGDGGTYRR